MNAMDTIEQIDIDEAKKMIDEGKCIVVDIRDPDSFESGHIDNAVPVNDTNIDEFVSTADKSIPLLCYCYMGVSSQNACQHFKEQGFDTVYSMAGGYTEWERVNESSGESSQEGGEL